MQLIASLIIVPDQKYEINREIGNIKSERLLMLLNAWNRSLRTKILFSDILWSYDYTVESRMPTVIPLILENKTNNIIIISIDSDVNY